MRKTAGLLLLATALWLNGCSAAASGKPSPPTTAVLSNIVWSINHTMARRKAAAQELLRRNPKLFFTEAKKNLLNIQRWVMLKYVLSIVVRYNRKDFAPLIIRSWARADKKYSDLQRPERIALKKLYPDQSPRYILISAFYQNKSSLITQTAAWAVLYRVLGSVKVRVVLAKAPAQTLLINDLQEAAKVLDVLPHNRRSVLWLIYDLSVAQDMWHKAAKVADSLSAAKKRGLAIRHICALAHLPEKASAVSLETLYAKVGKRLSAQVHQRRNSQITGDWRSFPLQKVSTDNSSLCWGDVAQIDELLHALGKPGFRQKIFAQARADYLDKTSEHGGVITWRKGQLIAAPFAPAARGNDRRFIASKKLIESLYTGLAHYHFHAQKYNNSAWAGPGEGDLNFASRFAVSAVVFTFINKNTLNVDYYKPGNVIVDLGMIKAK